MTRWAAAVIVGVAMGMLPATGCNKKQAGDAAGAASLGSGSGSVAGIKWSVPKRWTTQGERPMRVATYSIPPDEGDTEQGECAVFYFGNDQGGGVEDNIDRWVGQFETSGIPVRAQKEYGGLPVTLVQIAGTYLAPGGPMMQSTGRKEEFRLLGAIVEGPQGSVFFKFTGPAKTVTKAEEEFNAMVGSLAKM
ncbi:MAG: hypothetical protein AB1428_14330 [Bacteroidota bacterium]